MKKNKYINKIKLKKILMILFNSIVLIFVLLFFVFALLSAFGGDSCVTEGYCKEGEEISKIVINKKSCLENNWKWLEDKKACILK